MGGLAGGVVGSAREAGDEGETWDDNVMVGGTSTLSGDNGAVVLGGDFVHNTDKALLPAVLVVVGCAGKGAILRGRCAVPGIGEAGLYVWQSGEVECQVQTGDVDVHGGEGADTAHAAKGFGREVGAVGQVENGLFFRAGG